MFYYDCWKILEPAAALNILFEFCFTFLKNGLYIRGKCPIYGHREIDEIL
jgi:hypothetical protein